MEVEYKNTKFLNYEELMTKQPSEISGLWNKLRKGQKK